MFPIMPMMNPFTNRFLNENMKPVRLYRLLQSICNFETDEYTPTKDLAKIGRTKIFDFDYPLSQNVSRETFEVNILNHFMNRRIGFETPTAFKISLKAKLNEIMPTYNKMFDMLNGWNLFQDGETIEKTTEREYGENGDYEKKNTGTDTIKNTGTNTTNNTGTDTTVENGRIDTVDKNSNMPQSEIENVQDDDYLTTYKINEKSYNNLESKETLNLQNLQTLNTQNQRTANLTENQEHKKNINETITESESHSEKDKIKIYKEFLENRTSIYTMIYDELETCFYGLL